MAARGKANGKYQGSKWIRREKRLAIYLRDGMACAYCASTIEDGTLLTLDHITPHCDGGSNHEHNLVTACLRCNSSRANRPVKEFAITVAAYLDRGITAEAIINFINETIERPLDIGQAKAIIANRQDWAEALSNR